MLGLMKLISKHDVIIKNHIEKGAANAQYISASVQNEFILLIAKHIRAKVLESIRNAKEFCLLVDEASDVSKKEWASFFFRFVNSSGDVQESFVGLSRLENTTSETLFNTIRDRTESWGLNLTNAVGQAYDGASNMSGHVSGLQARVREVAKDCLYIHCCNHNLQLSLVEVAKIRSNGDPAIPCILECFSLVQAVYNFISSSPQRNDIYRKEQENMGISNDNVRALQALSDTRWSCRAKALRNIKKTFPAILDTLEHISETARNLDHRVEANALVEKLSEFPFIISFHCPLSILEVIETLSQSLQRKHQDLANAINLLDGVKATLLEMRGKFDEEYSEVLKWADVLDIEEATPLAGRRSRRRNDLQQLLQPMEYYRKELWEPTIDAMYNSLVTRFDEGALISFRCRCRFRRDK
jgi:hypothetical protein